MKKILLLALLTALICAGCARHYKITLNSGRVITTSNKPKLNASQDAYVFKDTTGRPAAVPAGSVKEIEPR